MAYPVFPSERFGVIVDLMNMNPSSKQVWLTMYYDYVDGHPKGYGEIKPVWLDAFQCATSELGGGSAGSKFEISSTPWVANFEGEIKGIGAHIHDGGTGLDIKVNKETICQSKPTYGTNEEAMSRANIIKAGGVPPIVPITTAPTAGSAAGHSHGGGKHIIAMSVCGDEMAGINGSPASPLKLKKLVKGQSWVLTAYYDYKKFDGMKNNFGGMDTVMGISIMYVKTKQRLT
jgi:hypothetical protein